MKTYATFLVKVDVSDMISNDLGGFLDIISEKAIGNTLLMDISYTLVKVVDKRTVLMSVSGDISEALCALATANHRVEVLEDKVAVERGCEECWPQHGKRGTCGSDCLMSDVAALREADDE